MRTTKGFTLIELAVVLAIIAVLAAVLTPLVTGYLDQARIARAQADVRTIADALKLHQRDTGRYPIYASASDYTSNTIAGGSGKVILGPGSVPSDLLSDWTVTVTTTLETYINGNFTGVSSANAFPKAAFRGPYVASIESDPWGNAYILTAQHLGTTSTNHAFVISAGPNSTMETTYSQAQTGALTVGSDDIVAVIK
jgi:prepilin-type N-terminal cleavage/methylation domain-containing protein